MISPSPSQVKKAASRIRKFYRGEGTLETYNDVIQVVEAYRALFSRPMNTVNVSLRRFCNSAEIEALITQRLKKVPTIEDKLVNREKNLNLASMHDIGGCRAVVPDLDALNELVAVIRTPRKNQIIQERNYIENPRASGYTAHHIIVAVQEKLPIEIQIRTRMMHVWAETVEGFSKELNINFKQDGEGLMFTFLKTVAEVFAFRESAVPITPELHRRYNVLQSEVKSFIREHSSSNYRQQTLPF